MTKPKWTKRFFADLTERVASTFLQSLVGTSILMGATKLDWHDESAVFATLGAPTLLALAKGLLANMANDESGASALPTPPGPEIDHEDGDEQPAGRHVRGQVAEPDEDADPFAGRHLDPDVFEAG